MKKVNLASCIAIAAATTFMLPNDARTRGRSRLYNNI